MISSQNPTEIETGDTTFEAADTAQAAAEAAVKAASVIPEGFDKTTASFSPVSAGNPAEVAAMEVPAGHTGSGFVAATVGFLTGLLAGILWFPRLYIAIPVLVGTCAVYTAFAVLLLRPNAQGDQRLYTKLTALSLVLVSILTGFAVGGTYLATTFCGLSTYTQWLLGSMNPCGVCISGNVFLWTAVIFWVAATWYAAKAGRELSMQQAEKSWGDDVTVLPPV